MSSDGFHSQMCHQQGIVFGYNKFQSLLVNGELGHWFDSLCFSQIYSISEIRLAKLDLIGDLSLGT
jgi:hypothetical protein